MAQHDVSDIVTEIITEVLQAAAPGPLVRRALEDGRLVQGPCRVVAVGKASMAMAEAAVEALGEQVRGGVVVSVGTRAGEDEPAAMLRRLRGEASGNPVPSLHVLWGDHPVPSERNVVAAQHVLECVEVIGSDETLLVLLSGGASALLCLPRKPLTRSDIASVTDALLRAGAPIEELNAVRKHSEVLKGGGLAAATGAGRIISLILSDVVDDRLDVIGSGPTAPDPSSFADALEVLERRAVMDVSRAVTALLHRGCVGEEPETIKPGDVVWGRVENRIIGNNEFVVETACEVLKREGYKIASKRSGVEGEAAEAGRTLARKAMQLIKEGMIQSAIVWGGETTVTIGDASGLGGRNQELALAAAIELAGTEGVRLLSFATDGHDGPTEAAGAVVDGSTARAIHAAGADPVTALADHDSYHALDAAGVLLRTRPTGTNINDLMVVLVG